jgi:hypothetical protein
MVTADTREPATMSTRRVTVPYENQVCPALCPAAPGSNTPGAAAQRASATEWPPRDVQSQDFVLDKQVSYKYQFAQIYFARLMELTTPLRARCEARWPDLPGASLQLCVALSQ